MTVVRTPVPAVRKVPFKLGSQGSIYQRQGRPPWRGGPPPAIGADEARGLLDFFAWREQVVLDGEERLLVPYEYPYDRISSSAEEAFAGKFQDASREHWVLAITEARSSPRPDPEPAARFRVRPACAVRQRVVPDALGPWGQPSGQSGGRRQRAGGTECICLRMASTVAASSRSGIGK